MLFYICINGDLTFNIALEALMESKRKGSGTQQERGWIFVALRVSVPKNFYSNPYLFFLHALSAKPNVVFIMADEIPPFTATLP